MNDLNEYVYHNNKMLLDPYEKYFQKYSVNNKPEKIQAGGNISKEMAEIINDAI